MKNNTSNLGPMLNAYPDSLGGTLSDIISFLQRPQFENTFASFYILPSIFNTDLDRGFSVIDYELNTLLACEKDLQALETLGIDLKLDFVLNHISILSKPFQDLIKNGKSSRYKDFFINWNQFWQEHGTMTADGYIQPTNALIKDMFFRKPGLPLLMVRMPDGEEVPYWNTFYQQIYYPPIDVQDLMANTDMQYCAAEKISGKINRAIGKGESPINIDFGELCTYKDVTVAYMESRRKYLGQMDLNIQSPLVWEYYENTLSKLCSYGAKIIRLDAFAYTPKAVGEHNFLNEPGTWNLLERLSALAAPHGLTLLPEIHAGYATKTYEKIAQKGYMVYDFFLPGLVLNALELHDGTLLVQWANEQLEKGIHTVTMLGCHDGIPLLDLEGLLSKEQIQYLIDTVVKRGGYVKNLHGQENVYYQVNATYYSALGANDRKMLLARALQLFMPGKPQVWYLDLFAGENDYEAVRLAGPNGHKEINRTNLTTQQIEDKLQNPLTQKQLTLLQMRNTCSAFCENAMITATSNDANITLRWEIPTQTAVLKANLASCAFTATVTNDSGSTVFCLQQ